MKGTVTTPIPAELESVASDAVVSSAQGIYDYRFKRNQELINQLILTWYEGE